MSLETSHAAALAQPADPDDRATDFKAVEGETGEHYSGYTLMVEAYAAIWLILMVWLVFLWRKQVDLTARVSGLEAAIARAEKKLGAGRSAREPEPNEPAAKREPETETSA